MKIDEVSQRSVRNRTFDELSVDAYASKAVTPVNLFQTSHDNCERQEKALQAVIRARDQDIRRVVNV
jgi:hypothetical protein